MPEGEYFEIAAAEWLSSREKFFDIVLKDRLAGARTILDYGCGPGFLAVTLAKNYDQVYAFDISSGALECARVLNSSENLNYVLADDAGIASIADDSVDGVVSLAVVQHLSRESYEKLLEVCFAKLRSGGQLVLHVQLDEGSWKREDEWKSDTSVKGRLKYNYGLHNFGRPQLEHVAMVEAAGFTNVEIVSLADAFPAGFEDIGDQHLLTATKP